MSKNDLTNYFVEENEIVLSNFEQHYDDMDITENENNLPLELQIIITNKRLYSNSKIDDNNSCENIIDLETIKFVKYEHSQTRTPHTLWLVLGVLLVMIGLIMFAFQETIFYAIGGILLVIGVITIIVSAIAQRPHNTYKLIIGTSGEPIEIPAYGIKPEKIKEIQKIIFKAKENFKLINFTQK